MKAAGIILSGIYSDGLDPIVGKRTVASLPFGGRYRQIDFILSNMVNSGIVDIGIITKYHYQSLIDHLGSCQDWDLNRKIGGVKIIPPFATGHYGDYRGKIEELRAALPFLEEHLPDYVVVADTVTICNIDLRPVIAAHTASGRDLTVVCGRIAKDENGESELVFDVDGAGEVRNVYLNYPAREGQYSSIGIYVFRRDYLVGEIKKHSSLGHFHLERDLIQTGFNSGRMTIGLSPFGGVMLKNRSVAEYFRNSMALLSGEVHRGLFRPDRPVYTAVRDEQPAYYGENCSVSGCIIADGCRVCGSVKNTVLFRGAVIEEGACVSDSVIMDGCVIKSGAVVENAILDKNITVHGGCRLSGAPGVPVIVGKGSDLE